MFLKTLIQKIKIRKRFFCLCSVAALLAISTAYIYSALCQSDLVAVDAPYYNGTTGNNQVAICVNVDWGEDYIPQMLATFTSYDVKATFFLTGRWTEEYPDIAAKILDSGMEIGNHGLKHRSPNHMSYEENIADIEAAEDIIEDTLHIKTVLFAPAAGEIDEQVQNAAADLGYRLILWSVDTIDWQKPDVATIVSRVSDNVADGSIILMHPTENTAAALDEILATLEEKGYQAVPVSALIK
jgi:peptidoglycan/xylan/chitin deacetylase (PgdA/CDA1 family)